MTRIIKTKSGHEILMDDEDFEKFGQMKWHVLRETVHDVMPFIQLAHPNFPSNNAILCE